MPLVRHAERDWGRATGVQEVHDEVTTRRGFKRSEDDGDILMSVTIV